jgi:hypothetical protein
MVSPSLRGSEDHVTVANIAELKNAITWGVYRAMWYWFLTWLAIAIVPGAIFFAITIPKFTNTFANTKEMAYEASMKSDLRNLVTAEEAYFADSVKYTRRLNNFVVTTGNVLGPITVTSDGWTATITNINSPKKCAIFIGRTPVAPARREGEPVCE